MYSKYSKAFVAPGSVQLLFRAAPEGTIFGQPRCRSCEKRVIDPIKAVLGSLVISQMMIEDVIVFCAWECQEQWVAYLALEVV